MKGRSRSRARGRMLASRTLPEGFNPAHVSGLTAWFKASTGVTLGGTPLATGTTPPAVTIAATDGTLPTASALRIEITTGGARGTALFKWSVNDGTTFEATGVATAATVVLASANITVSFAVGTYNTDNVYRATVSQWNDRTANANNVSHATAANQPVRDGRNTELYNMPAINFDGTDDFLAAATAATWTFAHDGTGATMLVVCYPHDTGDGAILATGCHAATARGCMLNYDGASQRLQAFLSDGAAYIFAVSATASTSLRNAKHVFSMRYSETAGTKVSCRDNGTQVIGGATTGAPSGSAPAVALRIGTRSNATSPFDGPIGEVILYNRYLSDADVLSVERCLGREYGITVA